MSSIEFFSFSFPFILNLFPACSLLADGYHGITLKPLCIPTILCSEPAEESKHKRHVHTAELRALILFYFFYLPALLIQRKISFNRNKVLEDVYRAICVILINTVSLIVFFMFHVQYAVDSQLLLPGKGIFISFFVRVQQTLLISGSYFVRNIITDSRSLFQIMHFS